MASNAIHEMISAYAAGCMDKKNIQAFRDYVKNNGDLPVGELGELQNVISLLPVILELEKPSPALKDKVAKKLISLQDDIKDKIKTTRQTGAKTNARTVVASTEEDEQIHLTETPPDSQPTGFQTIPPITTETPSPQTRGTEFYESAKRVNPPSPTSSYDLPPRSVEDIEKDNSSGKIRLLWIALAFTFLILLGGLIIVHYSGNNYDVQITGLEQRISDLHQEVASTREFVDKYDELIEFMMYDDIQVVHLTPVDENVTGSGKLMVSFQHREGLLELSNMPTLGSNQAFQVWLISDGRSYSVGSFVPSRTQKYIRIPDIPYLPKNQIELVRVTIEPLTGSELPQGPGVLFGSVEPANTTPARRR